jgi:hypothetical protein
MLEGQLMLPDESESHGSTIMGRGGSRQELAGYQKSKIVNGEDRETIFKDSDVELQKI